MEKSNIIISIIIVLCIAAAVAAYGITNSNNPIFSDLSSMNSNNNLGDGIGNNSTVGNSSNTATSSGSSNGGSSNGVSSGGSSSSGSHQSSSSSSSRSSSGGSSSSGTAKLSYATAKSIANGAVGEPGCYAGSGYYSGGYWYFTILDEDGKAVDTISVNDATGATGRG
ncbi:endoglucanase [uncultured Methanobrevibacter sp.]|uniref:endoglucanase n=1 Tax=uncultured Methanobrevibacter sp. TaxID=253161 RepID=UPI0025E5E24E|nr:endoglucanase [uncultured Methanobrevibacter sp.]